MPEQMEITVSVPLRGRGDATLFDCPKLPYLVVSVPLRGRGDATFTNVMTCQKKESSRISPIAGKR